MEEHYICEAHTHTDREYFEKSTSGANCYVWVGDSSVADINLVRASKEVINAFINITNFKHLWLCVNDSIAAVFVDNLIIVGKNKDLVVFAAVMLLMLLSLLR